MSKQSNAGAGIGALLGLLLGGGRYHLDRKKEEEERKRQEELTAEELRRYEADQTRKDRAEKQRADQYRGQVTRSMEQEGYTRRPTLAGNYGDIAKLLSMRTGEEAARPSPGFTGPMEPEFDLGTYHPDVGSSWQPPPPEPEPFAVPPDVPGQIHTWTDPESGRPHYTRSHLPDGQTEPGQMIDIPGTDYQMDINTSQGRQMVLEMWREQNAGKNPFEAAEGRFRTLYGNYPDPEMDAQAEMGLIAAEISAQNTLFALAPQDLFIDVLVAGNNIPLLEQMGQGLTLAGTDVAALEALLSYIEVLKKRAGMGR